MPIRRRPVTAERARKLTNELFKMHAQKGNHERGLATVEHFKEIFEALAEDREIAVNPKKIGSFFMKFIEGAKKLPLEERREILTAVMMGWADVLQEMKKHE